jgi:hypothetical protein
MKLPIASVLEKSRRQFHTRHVKLPTPISRRQTPPAISLAGRDEERPLAAAAMGAAL